MGRKYKIIIAKLQNEILELKDKLKENEALRNYIVDTLQNQIKRLKKENIQLLKANKDKRI